MSSIPDRNHLITPRASIGATGPQGPIGPPGPPGPPGPCNCNCVLLLSDIPGGPTNEITYCAEVDASYTFVTPSALTVDGWTVINSTVDPAGQWFLIGDTISIAPIGGGADDWPRLMGSAALAMAYKGKIILRPGDWQCKSVVNTPSGLFLEGSVGVHIIQTLAGVLPIVAAFSAIRTNASATTFAANNVVGSKDISINASTIPGNLIVLIRGLRVGTYTVVSVAGVGPYTVTLDRPVLNQYLAGDTVLDTVTVPQDIHVNGNGMTVSGTGVRYVELEGSRRCLFEDIRFIPDNGSVTDLMVSFDVGGYENEFRRITTDGGGISTVGIALESNERSLITECNITNCTLYGIALYDDTQSKISDSNIFLCSTGLAFVANGSLLGSFDTEAENVTVYGCTVNGVVINSGSTRIKLNNVSSEYNGNAGLILGGDGSVCNNNLINNFSSNSNAAYGVFLATGAKGTLINNLDISLNGTSPVTGIGMAIMEDTIINGIVSRLGNGAVLMTIAAPALVKIDGFDFISDAVGINIVIVAAGSKAFMSHGQLLCGAGSNGINANGVLSIDNATVAPYLGAAAVVGLVAAAATSSARIGQNVDVEGCATPLFPGGNFSTGDVVATGAVPVAVAFPDLRATTDDVQLTLKVIGGVPGLSPFVTKTSGTGFTITSIVGDTSTYNFKIN